MNKKPTQIKPTPGRALAVARKKWDMSQEKMAAIFGLDRTRLSKLESQEKLTRAWAIIAGILDKHGPKIFT